MYMILCRLAVYSICGSASVLEGGDVDRTDFLERVVALLQNAGIRYCVVGGLAVNAYAEPVVTLDFDITVAAEDLPARRDSTA